jgi:hypothetical protein
VDHIEPDRTLQAEALALATHLDHPVYDCLYLVLARREVAALLSADQISACSSWPPGCCHEQWHYIGPHEASLLNLVIDMAHHDLGWAPLRDFATAVERAPWAGTGRCRWGRVLPLNGASQTWPSTRRIPAHECHCEARVRSLGGAAGRDLPA